MNLRLGCGTHILLVVQHNLEGEGVLDKGTKNHRPVTATSMSIITAIPASIVQRPASRPLQGSVTVIGFLAEDEG